MAEVPAASFPSAEKPKPSSVREKIPLIGKSPEDKRIQREAKDRQRELRIPIPKATVDSLKDQMQKKGYGLNIQEDQNFKDMVKKQEDAMLQNPTLATGLRNGKLGPSQKAEAATLAYAEFSTLHPNLAEHYAREGIHLVGSDKTGYLPDVNADPFWRAAQEQARVLRAQGDIDGARQIVDDFALKYRTKAELYGANGAKELEEAVKRVGSRTPDAGVVAMGAPASIDAGKTVSFAEQTEQTKRQLDRMVQLAKEDPSKLKAKDLNVLKTLEAQHRQGIDEARRLNTLLRTPGNPALDPQDLAKLEPYEDYIMAQDADKTKAAQQAVAAGAPTAAEIQAKADQAKIEKMQRDFGKDAIKDLSSKGVDISTMDEKVAIERLKDGMITNADGSKWIDNVATRDYIHAAYVEQQQLLSEIVMAKLPQNEVATLEKQHKGDALGLALALLALAMGSLAPEVRATIH